MLQLFTDIGHYNPDYRRYLPDILRPFIPKNSFKEYGINENLIQLVDEIEKSDICLLPMAWNYYIDSDKIHLAEKFIITIQRVGKKVLIWVYGDYFIPLPQYDNIIGMYFSAYKSINKAKFCVLPVIINDPLSELELKSIKAREYRKIPSIGFCGQVDSHFFITAYKYLKLLYHNITYYLSLSKYYFGPVIPATYIRKRVLDILDNSECIKTDFIRRKRYHGGKTKREDLYNKLRLDFLFNIINNDYTVCIRGGGNFSARFYETLAAGRIPLFINTDCVLPFNNEIDWYKHVVWIEKNELDIIREKVIDFHASHTAETFKELQLSNRTLWEQYFYFPNYYQKLIMCINQFI